ncbi:hypothetical protein [Cohnella soli]|uniref:Actin-like protein N-terminal domain-containing protein n=1 Tax=Cohnella soli TaxID=425005 RepID=A0ABW0HNX3_9BACL
MTSVYIGFYAYLGHNQEISKIPGLVGSVPDETQEGDLIYTIEKDGALQTFCAGQTAVDVSERISPIEGDEQWMQLLIARLASTSTDHELAIALPITAWEDRLQIQERLLSSSYHVHPFGGVPIPVKLQHLSLYPAITAAFYDLHLQLVDEELQPRNTELLDGRLTLLVLVGSRQTEWILARGMELVKGGILYCGISTVQLEVKEFYYHKSGKSLLPADADAALHTHDVEIDGKYIPVDKQIETGIEALGATLRRDIEEIRAYEGADYVFLAGEGITFVDRETIQQLVQMGVRVVDDPEQAILRGLDVLQRLVGDADE